VVTGGGAVTVGGVTVYGDSGGGAATADEVVKDGSPHTVVDGAAVDGWRGLPLFVAITTITITNTTTIKPAARAVTVTGHGIDHESAASSGAGSSRGSWSGKASTTGGGESLTAWAYSCSGSYSGELESTSSELVYSEVAELGSASASA
jgi:hypothetical protein